MIRKIILALLIIFLSTNQTFSQKSKTLFIPVNKTYKIGFYKYDKKFQLYQNPFILKGKKKYKIIGYDTNNSYSGGEILSISPNKKYIILDNISKGYVDDGTNKTLYENYSCVIIDLYNKKVLLEMQDDCGGNWNKENEWISNEKLIF